MPPPGRILVFSPHPDDVELFLGGTLLKHVRDGDTLRVVMMTHGEKGSLLSLLGKARQEALKRERDEELRERYLRIPSVELSHLGLPDMSIRPDEDTLAKVLAEFDSFHPRVVYLPESTKPASFYTHPDHLATGAIVEAVNQRQDPPAQLRYYHSRHPNTVVDVSAFHAENLRALRCYKSQYRVTAGPPFLLHLLEGDRYLRTRKLGKQVGTRFAEAFREV
jgi:LmbE family N-acetylglucosaminyl deacetylase